MLNIRISRSAQTLILLAATSLWLSACSSSGPMRSGYSVKQDRAAYYATKMIGARYRYGGNNPSKGFDCSGLVQYSYKLAGVSVPRSTEYQFRNSRSVRQSELRRPRRLTWESEFLLVQWVP